jgi:hypothetical protein
MPSAKYKALLVGVSEFSADPENLLPLHGPPHDVAALRGALANRDTGLVTDAEIIALANPTKSAAEHAILEFFSAGQRDDVLVFYFSGHGRLTREGKLFLCATDTVTSRIQISGIAASTLRDCMEASDARTLVVILDCCHSGAFRGEPIPSDALGGRGTFFLASSRARQLADDGDGRGPSPFTAAIVSALADPAADIDGDGLITFDDLYRVAYAQLAPRKQFPQRVAGEGTVALARSLARGSRPIPVPGSGTSRIAPLRGAGPEVPLHAVPASVLDATADVPALVRAMHVRLLAGFAPDAVIHAAAITERSLAVMAGRPADATATLGDLLVDLRRTGTSAQVADASWLDQTRRVAYRLAGQVCAELDDDARRASKIALGFAETAGLVNATEAAASQRSAEWQASAPASSALLRLDRAAHRKMLDDLLELPHRVFMSLVHGEIDQGHDHFSDIMAWRLRAGPHGRWREIEVRWPPPSPSLGTRLATLFEDLARALDVALAPPADDPSTAEGAQAWAPALAPILAALDACRDRLLVRHVLRWLATGAGGDAQLVEAYARAIWTAVAARSGERIVVGLDLRRIEHGGLVLSKTWRASRTELAAARAIAQVLDRLDMPHGGLCITLPELSSVAVSDLVDWLRADGGRKRDAAAAEADQLVASTRGGRFDLIVERLTALDLDRQHHAPHPPHARTTT